MTSLFLVTPFTNQEVDIQSLGNVSSVTELVVGRAGIQTQLLWL